MSNRLPVVRRLAALLGAALMLCFASASADNIVHGTEHAARTSHVHDHAQPGGSAFADRHQAHHAHEGAAQAPDGKADLGDHVGVGHHHHHGDGPTGFVLHVSQPGVTRVELSHTLFRRSDDPPPGMTGGGLERPPRPLARIV